MTTLDRARVDCARAGLPVVDLNGGQAGFSTTCPSCPGQLDVRLVDGDLDHKCPGGCDWSTIADQLYFRTGDAVLPPEFPSEKVPGATALGDVAPGTPKLRRCDVAGMLTTVPEPVDWLVEGVVARGTLTMLAGREKEGKSLLSLGFGGCAAGGGGEVAGLACQSSRVLVVDAENGDREIHRRVRSLGLDAIAAGRLEVFEARGFDLARDLDDLDDLLTDLYPDLLVLDSWRSLWSGEENDSGEVSAVLDPLRGLIRERNVGAVLIHHMRKGGGYRGSTAVGASVENILELARHDDDPDRRRRRLHNRACRYEQEAEDRWLRVEADRERGLLLIEPTDPYVPETGQPRGSMKERLLGVLTNTPTAWPAWAHSADVDPKHGTARRARDELVAEGCVEPGVGGFRLVEGGGEPPTPAVA